MKKSSFGVSLRFWILAIRLDHLSPYCHQLEVSLRFRMDFFRRDSMSSMNFCSALSSLSFTEFSPLVSRRDLRWVRMATLLNDFRNHASLWFGLHVDGLINEISPSSRHSGRGKRKNCCLNRIAMSNCVVWHQAKQQTPTIACIVLSSMSLWLVCLRVVVSRSRIYF